MRVRREPRSPVSARPVCRANRPFRNACVRSATFRSPTLHELAERLDATRFVRVHRSAVVNIERIVQLEARSHGEFDVVLERARA